MQSVPSSSPHHHGSAVYIKTAKGRAEIARRSLELSTRQRQVLILVDGVRPLNAINRMLLENEFSGIIGFLHRQELIVPRATPDTDRAPAPLAEARSARSSKTADLPDPARQARARAPAAVPLLTDDPAQFAALKQLLSDTAINYLGLLSSDICRRIEQASDPAQLFSVLGQWHMALRQSKRGGAYAGQHLRQIEAGFYGGALPAWPVH